jgi:FtsP/CotA-like multicopper oxidase with cupredoxin domain
MLSRSTIMFGALATSASFRSAAQAQNPPAGGPDGNAAPRTVLRLQRRNIGVNGKPASVYGIRQPDGTSGITTDVGKPFRVRVENRIDEPSLVHWHGLAPPWQQDGVPGISGPAIPPGGSAEYDFPLRFGGTFWMHSHQGLQEQLLMAAPLIIRDQRDRPNQQEVAGRFQLHAARPDFCGAEKGNRYGHACGTGWGYADLSEGVDAEHAEGGCRRQAGPQRRQIRCFSRQ